MAAHPPSSSLEDELGEEFEALESTAEEWPDDSDVEMLTDADRTAIETEIADLEAFAEEADSAPETSARSARGQSLFDFGGDDQ